MDIVRTPEERFDNLPDYPGVSTLGSHKAGDVTSGRREYVDLGIPEPADLPFEAHLQIA
jgi:hypothetical protein